MITPVPSDARRRFLDQATTQYQQSLNGDVVEYLTQKRGLEQETVEHFRLGSVATPLPGHEHVAGYLAIPYLTPSGDVVSIRFRSLSGGGAKYMSMAADPPRIYNTGALEAETSGIAVCEGEIDTMTASQAGLPAVGIPGSQAWQKRWWRLLVQYKAVFVLHDDDDAGRNFGKTIAESLENARLVPMIGGDVNTFYREHGAVELRRKAGVA